MTATAAQSSSHPQSRAGGLMFLPAVGVLAAAMLVIFLAAGSTQGGEFAMACSLVTLQTLAVLFWIGRIGQIELSEERAIREADRHSYEAARADAFARIESSNATAANSLVALGMAASALYLLYHARDVSQGGDSIALLAVAPKAFAATGFGIVCALVIMLRAHFTGVPVLPKGQSRVLMALDEDDDDEEDAEPAEDPMVALVREFKDIATNLQQESATRAATNLELSIAVAEISGLIKSSNEAMKASSDKSIVKVIDRVGIHIDRMTQSVTKLEQVFTREANESTGAIREEILTRIKAEAHEVFKNADREVRKTVVPLKAAIQESVSEVERATATVRGESKDAAQRVATASKRASESVDKLVEDAVQSVTIRADQMLRERIERIAVDVQGGRGGLQQVNEQIVEMNQCIHGLDQNLRQILLTLRMLNGVSEEEGGSAGGAFLEELKVLCAQLERLTTSIVGTVAEQRDRKTRLAGLRTEIQNLLADAESPHAQ